MFIDYDRGGIPWMLILSVGLYIVIIYYMIFNTEKVVDYIYKEKEEEREINFNFSRTNTIYLAVVLGALFGLVTTVPSYLIELIRGVKESATSGGGLVSFLDILDTRQNGFYFLTNGVQIIVLWLVLNNATRVTAWIEANRKKKMGNTTDEIE